MTASHHGRPCNEHRALQLVALSDLSYYLECVDCAYTWPVDIQVVPFYRHRPEGHYLKAQRAQPSDY